jgi:hypothetical protein
MSRAKRVRKARSAARRERRYEKACASAIVFHVEANQRAQLRRDLNESDAPDALKKVLGFLIDPTGFVVDEMRERVTGSSSGRRHQ